MDRCKDVLPLIRPAYPNGSRAWAESEEIRQAGESQARALEGTPAQLHRVLVQEKFQKGSPRERSVDRTNGEGKETKTNRAEGSETAGTGRNRTERKYQL